MRSFATGFPSRVSGTFLRTGLSPASPVGTGPRGGDECLGVPALMILQLSSV